MPTLTKLFTMQQVSQHNTKDDCWLLIDGKVYDVTSYLEEHPGGDDVLLAATGKDATEEFEDVGHTKDARELMEKFCVGELDRGAPAIAPGPEDDKAYSSSSSSKEANVIQKMKDLPLHYWAVPAGVVGISMVVGFLYLRKK